LHAGDNDVAIGVPADCPASDIRDVAIRSVSLVTAGASARDLPAILATLWRHRG
jgi:hypothetical protein